MRAIDWLTFDSSTYADAIIQSNVLTRLFLSKGRLHAAKMLRDRMPTEILAVLDTVDVSMDQNIERSGWDTFFTALEAHVAYKAYWATRPADVTTTGARTGGLSKLERMNWIKALSQVVEQARDLDLVLLKRDWLKIPLPMPEEDSKWSDGRERTVRHPTDLHPRIVFRLTRCWSSRRTLSPLTSTWPAPFRNCGRRATQDLSRVHQEQWAESAQGLPAARSGSIPALARQRRLDRL